MARRVLRGMLCVFILALASGCGATPTGSAGATQPTATTAPTVAQTATLVPGPPTPTNVPSGWQVNAGQHFTIAFPATWTFYTSRVQTGLSGEGLILNDPAGSPATGQIDVQELWGYSQSQLQSICQLPGSTVTLAGLSWTYSVLEGVQRNWQFVNSNGVEYVLHARDANLSSSVQQQHDSILATFRPDDVSTGCA